MAKKIIAIFSFSLLTFFLIFFSFTPSVGHAAGSSLTVSQSSGTYEVGKDFTVYINVSGDTVLNAVSASILFPPSLFAVQSLSKSGSILSFWATEPTVTPATGIVRFEGVALGGAASTGGRLIAITVKPLQAGTAAVSFQSGQVLANDGQGTDITGAITGAMFTIVPAVSKPTPTIPTPPASEEETETENSEVVVVSTPKPPQIMFGSKYGEEAILGVSGYPRSELMLTFVASDGAKVYVFGESDSDGSFRVVVPSSLKSGTYQVSAVLVKGDGTSTDPSNSIVVEIGNLFTDASFAVWIIVVLFALLAVYFAILSHSRVGQKRNLSRVMRQHIDDAEQMADKAFGMLRSAIHDLEKEKVSSSSRRKISSIEKSVDAAQKVVEKKIKNISAE